MQALTGIPETFEDVAENVFSVLPKTNRVDFVTDSYHPNSIKSFERYRRGSSPPFLLSGPRTKSLREWKSFMSNDKNKTQLIKLLLSEWQKPKFAERLHRRDLFFTFVVQRSLPDCEVTLIFQTSREIHLLFPKPMAPDQADKTL